MRLRTCRRAGRLTAITTLALALTVGAAGCGGSATPRSGGAAPASEPAEPTDDDRATDAPTPEVRFPEVAPLAQEEFRPAYLRLLRANSHQVTLEAVGEPRGSLLPTVEAQARFSLAPLAMDLLITQSNLSVLDSEAPDTLARHTIVARRASYSRPEFAGSPMGDCWLAISGAEFDPAQVEGMPEETIRALTAPPDLGSLTPLMVLDRYRPSDHTTALGTVLAMLGLDRQAKLEPRLATERVPLTVVVEGGRITEVQFTSRDIAATMTAADERLGLHPEVGAFARLIEISGPPGWRIRYEAPGEPVTVTAPTRLYDPVTETCP